MKNRTLLAVTLVLTTACSGGSEPLPIDSTATLEYAIEFFGLSSDKVALFHDFTRRADGGITIQRRVEDNRDAAGEGDGEEEPETIEPVHCDANGVDPEGKPHCVMIAAEAPIFMPTASRAAGASFHGFRVKEELDWNGHRAVRVAGRDGWTWWYSRDTGLFLGGEFIIAAGGFRVELVSSEGFGGV